MTFFLNALFFFVLIATTNFAFDFDGTLYNSSGITAEDAELLYSKLEADCFTIVDCPSVIFAQSADGVRFLFAKPQFTFSAYGGYRGLITSCTVTMKTPSVADYVSSYTFIPNVRL